MLLKSCGNSAWLHYLHAKILWERGGLCVWLIVGGDVILYAVGEGSAYGLGCVFFNLKYMKQMRKASRQKPEEWALEVFDKAPYVTVSMVRADGTPYGVPLSLVRSDDKTFYFHCANEGEKIDCICSQPIVSLSAVSRCSPRFEEEKNNFTEHYNSAIAIGRAEVVTDSDEKVLALRLLCERFLPKYMQHFDEAVERSLGRTTVVRITLTEPAVGKCKS